MTARPERVYAGGSKSFIEKGTVKRGYFERAGEFIREVGTDIKELAGSALDSFKRKMATWYRDYLIVLNDKRQLPPELAKRRASLISNGKKIIAVAEKMGIELNQEYIEQNLGLAFVPVILGVAAAGLLAMVASWYYDDRELKRLDKLWRHTFDATGSTEEASKAVHAVKKEGVFKGFGVRTENIATKLIIGGVVLGGIYFYMKNRGAI